MTKITIVQTNKDYQIIEDLANIIWNEHYIPIIGKQQVDYMLDKFQSASAMQEQVENGSLYYLIENNKTVVGYLSFNTKNEQLFLSKLYVLSSQRDKGIGRFAMNFLESKTNTLGLNKIQLTVNKYNTNSIKAYEKMGFKNINAVVQDIGNGYVMDDYVFEKVID